MKDIPTYAGENINFLSEEEWRRIHNALSLYQSQTRKRPIQTEGLIKLSDEIQQLMDKVRDNYITPSASFGRERST